jgi:hypothetical protein
MLKRYLLMVSLPKSELSVPFKSTDFQILEVYET